MVKDDNPFVPMLDLNQTPLKGLRAVQAQGRDLVILQSGSSIVAMDRWCPHMDGDMVDGRLVGKYLKCPVHGFMFALATGRGVNCPTFSLKVHELKVIDGIVSVRLTS